jgi:integrase
MLEPLRPQPRASILDPARLGALLRAADKNPHTFTWYALQLLPLLFVRPGELLRAEWREFDLEHAIWRIPAHRMKMRHEHVVPLSAQALRILRSLKKRSGDACYCWRPGEWCTRDLLIRAL